MKGDIWIIEDISEEDAYYDVREKLIGKKVEEIEIDEESEDGWVGGEFLPIDKSSYFGDGCVCFYKVKLRLEEKREEMHLTLEEIKFISYCLEATFNYSQATPEPMRKTIDNLISKIKAEIARLEEVVRLTGQLES